MKSPYHPWLHRYSVLVAFCTLLLVVAGASVTSKEAGLSVPDWPLSYGQVLPEMTGGVLFETGHRLIATTVGFLTIILAIWISRVDGRSWMRKLGWYAVGGVVVQGLLGGMTVLWLQPPAVSTAHACLAQLFFSTTVAIAVFTSRSWQQGAESVQDYGSPSLRSLSFVVPSLVLIQIALGAAFRHRAIGLMPHIIGAMVVSMAILLVAVFVLNQFPNHTSLRPAGRMLLTVGGVQVMLGIAAYFARLQASEFPLAMVLTTVAHVATGGLTLASTVVLSIHIRRNVQVAASQVSQAAVTS
ncbi:MAG: COX15/CtaA family protein [Acidobacteriota bacterium]